MVTNFYRELFKHAFINRRPISATMEIIGQCNFRCQHCYISEVERQSQLSFDQAKKYVDFLSENGGMYLTITGGDPLLHPNFEEIYAYAYRKGLVITLLTNGSLLSERIADFLSTYPPRRIEITLYGFSEETYRTVTKTNAFSKVLHGVDLLISRKLRVILKNFVMVNNFDDFSQIANYAQEKEIPLKFDYMILAPLQSPAMKYQITREQIDCLEKKRDAVSTSKLDLDQEWGDFLKEQTDGLLFKCSAGKCTCWLKSDNTLRMCNFLDAISFDMNQYSYADAWKQIIQYGSLEESKSSPCHKCEYRSACNICPAKNLTIKGDMFCNDIEPYYCELAKDRLQIK